MSILLASYDFVSLFFRVRNKGLHRFSEIEKDHLDDENINTVFFSVDDMNKLKQAYPNYLMDTRKLTTYLSKIVFGEL